MDIRTLCFHCKSDYETAGYKLKRTQNKIKSECDKCNKYGFDYVVEFKEVKIKVCKKG